MMKTNCVVQDGKVIHVGQWQDVIEVETFEEVEVEGEDGAMSKVSVPVVKPMPNPLPAGAVQGEVDIEWTADGRIVLASDYGALRAAAYPAVGDQLEAMWKAIAAAGVPLPAQAIDVLAKIDEVKQDYPKPDSPSP
ncbi:hypothetical protein ACTMU2_29390 [Cupriavidus basilensis]